jgi:SagB-type dehydrogenase family enzyme
MLNPSTKLRTSPTLVIMPNRDPTISKRYVGIFDFLSKSLSYCSIESLYWLSYFVDWKNLSETENDHANYSNTHILSDITPLINEKLISIYGDNETHLQNKYCECWEWGLPVGFFHFSLLNNNYVTIDESESMQLQKLETSASPDLVWRGSGAGIESLPSTDFGPACDLIRIMKQRRTNRTSVSHSITKAEIGTCLYAGLGITGFVRNVAGLLPLSMTPSGGARNPFEAFVLVRRSDEIDPGVYHYCGLDHSLEKVAERRADAPVSHLFNGQDWMDEMAVVIVLVGMFERTMWKYQDPNAYRVVMIEAGHIGQNIMLAATRLKLTACPTAALCHAPLAVELGLENAITHVPIYALTLDRAKEYPNEIFPKSHISEKMPSLKASTENLESKSRSNQFNTQ